MQLPTLQNQRNWNLPYIQDPDVLRQYICNIGILGATIEGIQCVRSGMYELDGICFDDRNDSHDNLKLVGEVDAPVILVTDKGRFEIDYTESGTVFMGKNMIPPSDYCIAQADYTGYDSDLAFSVLKGVQIIGFQVLTQSFAESDDSFTGSYRLYLPEDQTWYIRMVQFFLSTGQRLVFESHYDWGYVSLFEQTEELAVISADVFRKCVRD